MTTPHTIERIWPGLTVAVLASGPSLTPELVARLRRAADRVIVVNGAHRLAPWADVLVALDGNWPDEFRAFEGMRITAVADDSLNALYIGPRFETIRLAEGHHIEVANSGLTAVRLAAQLGAGTIILAGFDWPAQEGHFYDDPPEVYPGNVEGLAAIVAELTAAGVTVRAATHTVAVPGPTPAPTPAARTPRGKAATQPGKEPGKDLAP